MKIINITKKQRKEILKGHNGTGYLIYKVNDSTTCEVGFFVKIKNGMPIPHRLTDGKPMEYNIDEEVEE